MYLSYRMNFVQNKEDSTQEHLDENNHLYKLSITKLVVTLNEFVPTTNDTRLQFSICHKITEIIRIFRLFTL